jgi:hypothetical protein
MAVFNYYQMGDLRGEGFLKFAAFKLMENSFHEAAFDYLRT